MKTKTAFLAALAAASLGLSALGAHAAEGDAAAKKTRTVQQARMETCNAQAGDKGLKGDERKAFMKECLSTNKQAKQQDKMKTCNDDASAKALKGDERKAFMKDCLSSKPAA